MVGEDGKPSKGVFTARTLMSGKPISKELLVTMVAWFARHDASELAGRSENNLVVNFPAPRDLLGRFVDVRITEARPHSLRGEPVRPTLRVAAVG